MLGDITAITTLGVKDLNVAKNFYENKLGFKPITSSAPEEVQMYQCGKSIVELYHSEFAGTNKTTVINWVVGENIKDEVEDLKEKGISFEHYDFPETKLEGDIHVMGDMKVAWFKDPDGNILSLVNHT